MNKNIDELSVTLVKAWLQHESEVSQEIGRTSMKAESKSVREVAQAYLDFQHTILNGDLPAYLKDEETLAEPNSQI